MQGMSKTDPPVCAASRRATPSKVVKMTVIFVTQMTSEPVSASF